MPKSDRYNADTGRISVGPGSYNMRGGLSRIGSTMSGRYLNDPGQANPGVGSYNIDRRDKIHHPYTVSGRSDKFMNMYSSALSGAPGVGAYNI